MRYTSRTIVEILLYTLVSVLVVVVWQFVRQSDREAMYGYRLPIALLMISAFWTYASGMSWAVEEQSVIPSLALGLAFAYDRIQLGRRRMMSVIVLTATVSVVTLAVWQKWSCAFNWEGWRQPITVDGYHSRWSPISDYKLDRADAEMYDAIFDDVQKYTRPGEEIVTFPTIPMFNFVGHHPQPGFAPVHEWDVCPDEIARRDAERMMAMKPRVIVNLRYNDWLLEFQDKGFRGGHKSGQREFQDNIDKLAASGEYRLTRRYLTPFYQMKLSVWVRE